MILVQVEYDHIGGMTMVPRGLTPGVGDEDASSYILSVGEVVETGFAWAYCQAPFFLRNQICDIWLGQLVLSGNWILYLKSHYLMI